MMPFSNGIILDNTNHYGIVKTETFFRLTPNRETFEDDMNSTETLQWIYSDDKFASGTYKDIASSRSLKSTLTATPHQSEPRSKKVPKHLGKKQKKGKSKLKKCILKVFQKLKKKKLKHKKFMVPLILGLLAAKSLLIPIALKVLAFVSVKGLMMGFFSTMLASVLSLKGMFDHSHAWNRREDAKTQVEIIQVPSKSNEHLYYDRYKRGNRIPF